MKKPCKIAGFLILAEISACSIWGKSQELSKQMSLKKLIQNIMKRDDGNVQESLEEILVSAKQIEKLNEMVSSACAEEEVVNLVPISKDGEQYLCGRYPIAILCTRSEIQEIAEDEFESILTEKEIQDVRCVFCDNYPHEIHEAIVDAIESVLDRREETKVADKQS